MLGQLFSIRLVTGRVKSGKPSAEGAVAVQAI